MGKWIICEYTGKTYKGDSSECSTSSIGHLTSEKFLPLPLKQALQKNKILVLELENVLC